MNISIANKNDALDIVLLVNRAYRPPPQQGGWTHESDLVSGARIDVDEVLGCIEAE